jgi:hypothetical protein
MLRATTLYLGGCTSSSQCPVPLQSTAQHPEEDSTDRVEGIGRSRWNFLRHCHTGAAGSPLHHLRPQVALDLRQRSDRRTPNLSRLIVPGGAPTDKRLTASRWARRYLSRDFSDTLCDVFTFLMKHNIMITLHIISELSQQGHTRYSAPTGAVGTSPPSSLMLNRMLSRSFIL